MGGGGSAWDLAHAAAEAGGVALQAMTDMDDARRVTAVVARVWGEDELRPSLARAFEHAGCGVYGAVGPDGELVGFVLGFLGWQEGLHLHSHMLAVLPEWRSRGIGYALKLAQRAACLDAAVEEVRWTFDPLVVRNGRFNLVRLGTVGTAFLPGFYGEMTDRINRDDRSDRFEVRWPLLSERVQQTLSGRSLPPPPGPVLLACDGDEEAPRPKETAAAAQPGAMIAVPADHAALRRRDPALGIEWREASARAFQSCFRAGLVVAWITEAGEYVFVPADEALA